MLQALQACTCAQGVGMQHTRCDIAVVTTHSLLQLLKYTQKRHKATNCPAELQWPDATSSANTLLHTHTKPPCPADLLQNQKHPCCYHQTASQLATLLLHRVCHP